jgi:hypothetical protein
MDFSSTYIVSVQVVGLTPGPTLTQGSLKSIPNKQVQNTTKLLDNTVKKVNPTGYPSMLIQREPGHQHSRCYSLDAWLQAIYRAAAAS